MTRVQNFGPTPRAGIGQLGLTQTPIIPPVSGSAQQASRLVQALGLVGDVVQGAAEYADKVDRYERGQAARDELASRVDLEQRILDPTNDEFVVPEGVTFEEFARGIIDQDAPEGDFGQAYRDQFGVQRMDWLPGTLATRAEAEREAARTRLLTDAITSVQDGSDAAQVDEAASAVAEDLGLPTEDVKLAMIEQQLRYWVATDPDGSRFEAVAAYAPPEMAVFVARERDKLNRRLDADEAEAESEHIESIRGRYLTLSTTGGDFTTYREDVIKDETLPTPVKLALINLIESEEEKRDRDLFDLKLSELSIDLRSASTPDEFAAVIAAVYARTDIDESDRARFLNVVRSTRQAKLGDDQTARAYDTQSLRDKLLVTPADQQMQVIDEADVADAIKAMFRKQVEDEEYTRTQRERADEAYERAEAARVEAQKTQELRELTEQVARRVYGHQRAGRFEVAEAIINNSFARGRISSATHRQMLSQNTSTAQSENLEALRVQMFKRELTPEETLAEAASRVGLEPGNKRRIRIDQFTTIMQAAMTMSSEDARAEKVRDVIADPSLGALTPADDGALIAFLSENGIVDGSRQGTSDQYVVRSLTMPAELGITLDRVQRVPTPIMQMMRSGLADANFDRVREAGAAYVSLFKHDPALAQSLDIGGIAGVRARFLAARAAVELGGEAMTNNEALQAFVLKHQRQMMQLKNDSPLKPEQAAGLGFAGNAQFAQDHPGMDMRFQLNTRAKVEYKKRLREKWGRRAFPEPPAQVLNAFYDNVIEEVQFHTQTSADEGAAQDAAIEWAFERTMREYPILEWDGDIFWSAQPHVMMDQRLETQLLAEFRDAGATDSLVKDLRKNYVPMWDDTNNGYVFARRDNAERLAMWIDGDGNPTPLLISLDPDPSQRMKDFVEQKAKGPKRAEFTPENTGLTLQQFHPDYSWVNTNPTFTRDWEERVASGGLNDALDAHWQAAVNTWRSNREETGRLVEERGGL
jgi:hypothetical protein